MKHLSTLVFAFLVSLLFLSCSKEKKETNTSEEKPVNPASTYAVTLDGKTYSLKVKSQNFKLGDTAHLKLTATAPEMTVIINAKSTQHENGVGNYWLACCSNDIYVRITETQKHWEIDHQNGGTQNGSVKITRMDSKGYEGTFTLIGNDYDISRTAKKEFTGSFVVIY